MLFILYQHIAPVFICCYIVYITLKEEISNSKHMQGRGNQGTRTQQMPKMQTFFPKRFIKI